MDYKLLQHAQIYIEKMANGIDPLTEKNIKEDDLLNNIRISRCLFYVNNILKEVILNNGYKFKKEPKVPFNLTKKQLKL